MATATARHILVETEQECEDIKKQIEAGADFGELAMAHSKCPSGREGGALGEFFPGQMVKEFADATFALPNKGDISDVVRSKFGYHIIKLTGTRDAVKRAYDDVKSGIESTLKAKKRKDAYKSAIEDIKKSLNFQVNKETIAALDFSIPKDMKKQQRPPFQRR